MTLLLSPSACPRCGAPFAAARDPRFVPSAVPTLSRLRARCRCGEDLVLCYGHPAVGEDEERALDVAILRGIRRRLRAGNPDRAVCTAALSRWEG
jgi:hypothetical protein